LGTNATVSLEEYAMTRITEDVKETDTDAWSQLWEVISTGLHGIVHRRG